MLDEHDSLQLYDIVHFEYKLSWVLRVLLYASPKGLIPIEIPLVTITLLMTEDLRLCGTHFPTTSELSQFVIASPTAKRRMLEPLASVLREDFRKRGRREIFEREISERDVI